MSDENQNFNITNETVARRTATLHWHAPLMRLFPSDDDRKGVLKLIEEAMALVGRVNFPDHWTTIGDVELQWQSEVDAKTGRITLHIYLFSEGKVEAPIWEGTDQEYEQMRRLYMRYGFEGAPEPPEGVEYPEAFLQHLEELKSKK